MFSIEKEFHFSASHQLSGLRPNHPCARPHGHNYVVVLVLKKEALNKVGFVRDYGDLNNFKNWVDDVLDHRNLNEVFPDMNPTAENLAWFIYQRFKADYPELTKVVVKETPKTAASYEP